MWLRFKRDVLPPLISVIAILIMLIWCLCAYAENSEETTVASSEKEVVENWSQLESIVKTELNLGKRVTITMQPGGYKQIEVTTPT